jgi:formylglycine-generating enzyme required for sulfatase activity
MKTRSLFISYRSSDAAKVDKIAKDLSLLKYDDGTSRFTTWQDKHNLPPASPNWWDAIVDAIELCEMFVFNLSRASLQSEVCRAELDYAHRRNRPIIPVVLDGEFFLNPQSGKYDLPKETWALVPDWLGQAQFLFYVETQFYGRFQEAVAVFERSWPRDIPAPRPLNPDSKSVHGSTHALYSAACDYAERLAFTDAEKHFDALVRRNDEDYADLAAQWLNLIRRYAELIEIVEHRSPAVVFNRKWTTYQGLFPNDLVEGIFDPKGFATREVSMAGASHGSPLRTPAPVASSPAPEASRPRSIDLLPDPFEWIEIPGGRGTMKTDEPDVTLEIPTQDYWIAKYPVTNAQFHLFIDAGGYNTQRWWTATGWEAKLKGWDWDSQKKTFVESGKPWAEPRLWNDSKWNGAEQPVVGVTWYEAVAFCLWLSDVTAENIMLPTEDQWQYAEQGDDGRDYPWGKKWDGSRCNNNVDGKGIGSTTPVRQYEGKGDSPFGVVDMAGNVWEWCLTDYDNNTNDINSSATYRVLRGGSWSGYNSDGFRCGVRYRINPHVRVNYWGFRLSLS